MTQCCAGGAGYCQHHRNSLTFENLRTKYAINEDIIVDYVLHDTVQASTRDWVGIFPRGWNNLQQYLTFEYALVAPRVASSPKRTILFLHAFHQEASFHTEYQLVYVSKQIQVLAASQYFRFTQPNTLQIPREQSTNNPDMYAGIAGYPPLIVLSDQSIPRPLGEESSMTLDGASLSTHSGGFLPMMSSTVSNDRHAGRPIALGPRKVCQHCHKSSDNPRMATGRARFLASHNNTLVGRVGRLERDLGLAEGAVKHARLARANLANRLQAYEAFVAEMLKSLAVKGMVKITDASGKEIVLQQVDPPSANENREEQSSPRPTTSEAQHRERVLKAVIAQQEQTIRQLMEQRKQCRETRENNLASGMDCKVQAIIGVIPKDFSDSSLLPTREQCNQTAGLTPTTEQNAQCIGSVDEKSQTCTDIKTQTKPIVTRAPNTNESTEVPKDLLCTDYKKLSSNDAFGVNGAGKDHDEFIVEPTKDTDPSNVGPESRQASVKLENETFEEIPIKSEPLDAEECPREIEELNFMLDEASADKALEAEALKMAAPLVRAADCLVHDDGKEIREPGEATTANQVAQMKPSAIVIQGSNVKFAIIRY